MEFTRRFNEKDLPDVKSLRSDAKKVVDNMRLGQTLFMKKHNVKSEGEYKKHCMAHGQTMKHSHIGWNSWESTAEGFRRIYEALTSTGSSIDRFGVTLDWVMGVPRELRENITVGTGIVFETEEEWRAVGQVVPVQPHFGDHMIGSLNSFENARLALAAGVTSIGNVSQYYSYEYPGIERELERTAEMVRALMLMGMYSEVGTIVHSNLDDGFGSQFHDLANLVGWAILERYIAEDLSGARISHCFGNLFSDPILRIIFNRAMGKINKYNTPGTMIYGNTIDFGMDFARNAGALGSFSLADAIGQYKYPSGHAVTPIPVSEAARIPSVEEIIEANRTVDIMIEKAPMYAKFINWDMVEAESEILVTCGIIFFERTLNALDDMHVDISHPGELLAMLKCIKPEQLEIAFGVGRSVRTAMRGRVPVRPTNIIKTITDKKDNLVKHMEGVENKALEGIRVIVGSTDVHEFGKEICKAIILEAGGTVFDLGSTVSTEELVDAIHETKAKVVLMSTFNGIALTYAKEVMETFRKNDINAKLIMGGLINETQDGSDLPVDVSEEVAALGVNCSNQAECLVDYILDATRSYSVRRPAAVAE
ncbi:MAG: cobalamin-dependent protein [Planctomycetaceae bacterium]|nr:cobalamin-dependent protein [Planctomycetaceae bacterium]